MRMPTLIVLAVLVVGCAPDEDEPEIFPVRFTASADGEALEGVIVRAGATELGRTDARGALDVTLTGSAGQNLHVQHECPAGYRRARELRPFVLRALRRIGDERARPVQLDIPCQPEERIAMLLVRAGVPELPVLVDGRERGRTDADGLAHVELSYAPHSSFDVVLRTTDRPELSPRNPPRSFTLSDANDVFVFDQQFAAEQEARAVRRARPRATRIPQRITTAPR